MNISQVYAVYFSATGNTRKVTTTLANALAVSFDVPLEVRSTKHGPIISGLTPDFTSIAAQPIVGEGVGAKESPTTHGTTADSLSGEYAVSLSWTALDAGSTGEAIFALNLGKNFDDFRAAAALFDVPAQNLIYADVKGAYKTSGFEYETIWALGADCAIDNLDHVAEADSIMDDIGVDSIEIPVAFGVAMEAGVLKFGDGVELCRILREEVAKGTPLGRIIGNGAGSVGRAYGVTRVPVVKNQAIPAYDPRAIKGIGITYATSTQGADHTMGYTIATNILGVGGKVDPLSKEGQVELSRNLQIATAAIDSTGMCLFIAFAALDDATCLPSLIDMINARFGAKLTANDVTQLSMTILKTEHAFNLAAGFTNKDDRLPEFFRDEPIAPHNVVWDITDEAIDSFWNF